MGYGADILKVLGSFIRLYHALFHSTTVIIAEFLSEPPHASNRHWPVRDGKVQYDNLVFRNQPEGTLSSLMLRSTIDRGSNRIRGGRSGPAATSPKVLQFFSDAWGLNPSLILNTTV